MIKRDVWNRGLALASLLATSIFAASVWLEWNDSTALGTRFSWLALAAVLAAAAASYLLRIARLYLLLSRSGIPISLRGAALVQAIGFALSVTPGSMGEVFKLHLIEERAGTPTLQSAPVLLLDRSMEGLGFIVLLFTGAALFPALRSRPSGVAWLLAALALVLALALLRRPLLRAGTALAARAALFARTRRLAPYLENIRRGAESSLRPVQIMSGLTLTALARVADGFVLLFAAQMLGVSLGLPLAIFVIALSGLAGGISLLPGGVGAVETTMAGLLMVSAGASLPIALGVALLARMSSLWLWVAVGLAAAFVLQLSRFRPGANHPKAWAFSRVDLKPNRPLRRL